MFKLRDVVWKLHFSYKAGVEIEALAQAIQMAPGAVPTFAVAQVTDLFHSEMTRGSTMKYLDHKKQLP